MDHFIPLSVPNFEGNEQKYVNDAVEQTWVSTGGAYINQLEKMLEEYLGVSSVAACQSGTSALHMALRLAGVNPGDMVIVPTLTFIAAVNPVMYQFAEPVFMDCDDSLCMDPVKLREFCETECEFKDGQLIHATSKKVVKAIVVVHVFGNMADMESIMDTAQKYGLKVIEDATEALGTKYTAGKYNGKYAGTIGDFGAYSFNGNKIITTGGGGAITARCKDEADHARYLSTQAKDDPHYYIHNEVGYNYRMTNVQAALGVGQMELLPAFVKRKQNNYMLYEELFRDYDKGTLMEFRQDTDSNKWFYSLVLDWDKIKSGNGQILDELTDGQSLDDDKNRMRYVIDALSKRKIQTRTIWGLINEQQPYTGCIAYKMEKAKYYGDRVLNIPCSTNLTEEEIRYVAATIKELL